MPPRHPLTTHKDWWIRQARPPAEAKSAAPKPATIYGMNCWTGLEQDIPAETQSQSQPPADSCRNYSPEKKYLYIYLFSWKWRAKQTANVGCFACNWSTWPAYETGVVWFLVDARVKCKCLRLFRREKRRTKWPSTGPRVEYILNDHPGNPTFPNPPKSS